MRTVLCVIALEVIEYPLAWVRRIGDLLEALKSRLRTKCYGDQDSTYLQDGKWYRRVEGKWRLTTGGRL